MRAIWTGALSFGLVNIPVRLFSASQESTPSFRMLHEKDLEPIQYLRVCRHDGKEVPYEDIVKGYEYQKGDYVVLTDEDFKKANVRKSKTIDIVDFADEAEVDTMLYEKPYYLSPDRGAHKPYTLLREALKKSQKVGIAKFVLRNREHLAVIKPTGDAIVLNQLRFAEEVRKVKELDLPDETVNKREIDMALALINQLTTHFNPKQYKDEYTKDLMAIIDQKAHGKTPKARGKAPRPTKVKDSHVASKEKLGG